MRSGVALVCLLAGILWLPQAAQAIVNIEGLRQNQQQEGLSGSVSLTFSGASGNTDKSAANSSARLHWQQQQSATLLIGSYYYGESSQTRDTNKAFAHLRHIIEITQQRAMEGFIQAEHNEFTRMSLRTLAGAGLRQTLHNNEAGQTHLGIGAFYSTETLEERDGLSDGGTEQLWRANIYLAVDYNITGQLKLESTSYFQPATSNRHDYRLLEQAGLKLGINDRLALKLSLDIAHDSQPPQTIDTTDVSYHSGIEYTF